MSSNRIHYFIKNYLQNSKLNREKFVKNKKMYNDLSKKNKINHSLIVKRNFNTNSYGLPPNNNNKNILMIYVAVSFWVYIIYKKEFKK